MSDTDMIIISEVGHIDFFSNKPAPPSLQFKAPIPSTILPPRSLKLWVLS